MATDQSCIVKLQQIISPIMEEPRGWRMLVATPNMQGRNPHNNKPCPSYEAPYYITHFGDFEDFETCEKQVRQAKATIIKLGFRRIELQGDAALLLSAFNEA